MSAICRKSWPRMSATSTAGAHTVRLDNVRPARRCHLRRVDAPKLEGSSQYPCSEVSIMFMSGPHDRPIQFLRPTGTPLVLMQHFRGTMDNWDPAVTDG